MQVCWKFTALAILLVLSTAEAVSVKRRTGDVSVENRKSDGELIIKPLREDVGELVIMPKSSYDDEDDDDDELAIMPKQYSLSTIRITNVPIALTTGVPAAFSFAYNTMNTGKRCLASAPVGTTLQLTCTIALSASNFCGAGLFQISAGGRSLSYCGLFGTFRWIISTNRMEVLGAKWLGGDAGKFNCSILASLSTTTTTTTTTTPTTTKTTTTPTTTTKTPTTTTTTTTTPTTTKTTTTPTTTTTTTPTTTTSTTPTTTTTTTPTTTTTTTTTPTTTTTTTPSTTTASTSTTTSTSTSTTTLSSITCRCGRKNPIVRIVGGVETTVHEYPWQVGLVPTTGTKPFCGGSIVSDQYIITAAHCVTGTSASSIRVVVGEHNTASTTETTATKYINAQSITIHPGYDTNTQDNDIAIIKLAQPITFPADNKVAPVCLPPAGPTYEGVQATVTGWGTTTEGGSLSNTLQEVTIPMLTNTRCKELLGTDFISTSMMCGGPEAGGKDSCQGDSGGPLTTSGGTNYQVLAGVVSWGYGCARPGLPGVYTRVNNYLPWINSIIAGSKTCPPP